MVLVAKNGWASAAYDEVATFQSKVVMGLLRWNLVWNPLFTSDFLHFRQSELTRDLDPDWSP